MWNGLCVCVVCVCACSVVSNSLQPFARLLCPWNFPGKNIGAGCHLLLWDIFLTHVSCISHWPGSFFTTATWDTPLNGLPNLLDISKGYLIDDLQVNYMCSSGQRSANLCLKGQVANILGSVSQKVSAETTQLCSQNMK